MKIDKEGRTTYEDGDECHIISNIGKPTVVFRFLCGKWIKVIDDPKPDEFTQLKFNPIRRKLETPTNTKRILAFIQNYYLTNGVPPSCRDIMEGVGFKSPRAVTWHLDILYNAGHLIRAKGWARGYVPVGYKVVREDQVYSV